MASIKAITMISKSSKLREQLNKNTKYFRSKIKKTGYEIKSGEHPIVPIMLGDAQLAKDIANEMLLKGIYVIGFSYPVVPKNEARIRVQISAAHTKEQLNRALDVFYIVGKKFNII